MDLMITRGDWWGQPTYGGVTLENNVFAHSTNGREPRWHYYGFLVHGNMGQLDQRADRQQHVRELRSAA